MADAETFELIWVSPHPSLAAENRVAVYEQHPAHPTADGWVMIDGADTGPHQVALTPIVLFALTAAAAGADPMLVRAEPPADPKTRASRTTSTS